MFKVLLEIPSPRNPGQWSLMAPGPFCDPVWSSHTHRRSSLWSRGSLAVLASKTLLPCHDQASGPHDQIPSSEVYNRVQDQWSQRAGACIVLFLWGPPSHHSRLEHIKNAVHHGGIKEPTHTEDEGCSHSPCGRRPALMNHPMKQPPGPPPTDEAVGTSAAARPPHHWLLS